VIASPIKPTRKLLKRVEIRREVSLQMRARIDPKTVKEYREALQNGAKFPPVVTIFSGVYYYLVDGWHRFEAYSAEGIVDIQADVYEGSYRSAQLYALSANATHGLRRTNKDKKRAVTLMLEDDEWAQWSDQNIAAHCGVSPTTVGKYRSSYLSNLERCDNSFVRTVTRGGTTYQQDTSRIGRNASANAVTTEDRVVESDSIGSVRSRTTPDHDPAARAAVVSDDRISGVAHSATVAESATGALSATPVVKTTTVVESTTPVVEMTTPDPEETASNDDPRTLAGFNALWNDKPQVTFTGLIESSRDLAWHREQFAEIMRILDVDDETVVVDMIRTLVAMANG
jgi:uncharacterized ParB-like nuclease family protein